MRLKVNNVFGGVTDGGGISSGAQTFHDTANLQKLPAVTAPDYVPIIFEPGTPNEEIAYVMAHGQEPPLSPQSPQLLTALTSGVAPASLAGTGGPVYTNGQQILLTYWDPLATVLRSQTYTVGVGSTATNIVLSAPANANFSYPAGTYVQPVATSTLPAGSYQVKATFIVGGLETNSSAISPVVQTLVTNADQVVFILGLGNSPVPVGVTSVNFYLVAAPGGVNLGLLGSVSPSGGQAVFQFSAPGNNTNFAPTTNATTGAAQPATILRGREGTAAVSHGQNAPWIHGPTAADAYRASYDWLYTPAGWDDAWINAQWQSGSMLSSACGVGSSIFEGGRATSNWMTNGYWPQIVNGVAARPGVTKSGDVYATTYSTAWAPAFQGTPPWVMDHAVTAWIRAGLWYSARHDVANNGANPIMHFTSPNACQSVEVLLWDNGPNGSQITANVDGGATQTFTLTGSGTMKRWSPGAWQSLSNAAHTVNFMTQSLNAGAGTMYIMAVATYYSAALPTTGIIFGWFGAAGLPLSALADPAFPQSVTIDTLSQWGGPTNAAIPYTWGFGAPTSPAMVWIDIPNDCLGADITIQGGGAKPNFSGYGPLMYEQKMRQWIYAMRSGKTPYETSVVLHLINFDNAITSEILGTPEGDPYSWPLYRDALYRIGRDDRCAIVNTNIRWLNRGPEMGMQPWGDNHPLEAGHTDIANVGLQVV